MNTPPHADPSAARALLGVSLAVLLASSTWFSGTAAAPSLVRAWSLSPSQGAWLTIAVQLGFIAGTLLYALLSLADVFNPRRVFFTSALLGAAFNAGFALLSPGLAGALAFRLLTGITLAGVYPVGMKIVASWFRSGLGWRLGTMVGALTLGTALPYLIQALGAGADWRLLVLLGSLSALLGGGLMLGVGDGPFLTQRAPFDLRMAFKLFRHPPFRATALGYFGHMWELYAFWSLVTFYLGASFVRRGAGGVDVLPLLAFATIGSGAVGCVLGGWVSRRLGERRVAAVSLLASATLGLGSGVMFTWPPALLVPLVLLWGVFVVSDSPQFSALAAHHCPPAYTGTALTVQNGIGFALTALSIQLLPWVAEVVGWRWAFLFLAPGPLVGAYFMRRLGQLTPDPVR